MSTLLQVRVAWEKRRKSFHSEESKAVWFWLCFCKPRVLCEFVDDVCLSADMTLKPVDGQECRPLNRRVKRLSLRLLLRGGNPDRASGKYRALEIDYSSAKKKKKVWVKPCGM